MSGEKELKEYFDQKKISEGLQEKLFALCTYKIYEPKTELIKIGEYSDYIFLVLKGMARGFYIDENVWKNVKLPDLM